MIETNLAYVSHPLHANRRATIQSCGFRDGGFCISGIFFGFVNEYLGFWRYRRERASLHQHFVLSKKAVSHLLGLNPGSHTSFYPLKEVAETDKVQVQNVGDQSWMFLVDNDKHNEFLSLANEGRACIRRRRKRNKSGPSRKKGKKAKHSQSK